MARSRSNSGRKLSVESTGSQKKKNIIKYIVSKQMPCDVSSSRADPVVSDKFNLCFIPCGNTILVYSLKSGMLVKTLRSKGPKLGDAHTSKIVNLTVRSEKPSELVSVCSQGTIAFWDI